MTDSEPLRFMTDQPDNSSLPQLTMQVPYWEDASVFLTGVTGFVGKAVLQKLLRPGRVDRARCPKEIFVLIREKKGLSSEARMHDLLGSAIFDDDRAALGEDGLRKLASEVLVLVPGDLEQENLGICSELRARIVENCTVILNCAADVSFDKPVMDACRWNVYGALKVLELAHACHRRSSGGFKCFEHVSTCYVNTNRRGYIDEALYKPAFDPEVLLRMLANEVDGGSVEGAAKLNEAVAQFPNTYTFSKHMAEQVLVQRAMLSAGEDLKPLPLLIVRPSIIGCPAYDPQPGFLDSLQGLGKACLMVGLGVVQNIRGDENVIYDIVPLDTVVDTLLAAPMVYKDLHAAKGSVPVVAVASSDVNPIKLGQVVEVTRTYFLEHPSSTKQRRRPSGHMDPTGKLFEKDQKKKLRLAKLLKAMPCTRQSGVALEKIACRLANMDTLFSPFMLNSWFFRAPNLKQLPKLLRDSNVPVQLYGALCLDKLDWNGYMRLHSYGLQRFILNEEAAFFPGTIQIHVEETIESSRRSKTGSHSFRFGKNMSISTTCSTPKTARSKSSYSEVEEIFSEQEGETCN